jgi:serine/threonine protein kinase
MQNTTNNKLYAIKIIRKSLVSNVIPLKILFREIMIHKTLIHPNIVRLVDHFEDITKIFLVLEFVEKGSLFDLIRRKIKLSESEACEILVQTCTGLNYLHENDIVHRDIKPENLLISKDDTIKICDFGWSASQSEKRVTFCGTLDYMSPEMINSEPHTTKLDVWAVGVLLYEMLHGAPPYRGKNPKEQYRLIAGENYVMGNHVSKSAGQLIRSILQLRPESRPTVTEVLRSQWVQEYSDCKLQRDWKVNHLKLGDGSIISVTGKIVNVNFKGKVKQMVEGEVLRNCVIYDSNHRLLHTPPEEESLPPRFDPNNTSIPTTSLYKKLGIDSGRATPISGRATPTGSRPHSRSGSRHGTINETMTPSRSSALLRDSASPNSLYKKPGTPANFSRSSVGLKSESSQVVSDRPPRSPDVAKALVPAPAQVAEALSRSGKVLRDFDDIKLQAEPVPVTLGGIRTKPKSSFLARFKAK